MADAESRTDRREIEWKLNPEVFHQIQTVLGVTDDVDLFASRVNHQLDRYVSWQPDPGAWQIDAFSLDWSCFSAYIFPPFSLVPRVLQRLGQTGGECTLVAPLWPTQSWFPKLLNLLVDFPVILPQRRDLLIHPLTGLSHPLLKKSPLIACRLSGLLLKTGPFRKNCRNHHSSMESRHCQSILGIHQQMASVLWWKGRKSFSSHCKRAFGVSYTTL